VRYIARKYAHPPQTQAERDSDGRPPREVASIKVYRVLHSITDTRQVVGKKNASGERLGISLNDPSTYIPYYMGQFDRDGELQIKNDPMLYWYVPIVRKLKDEEYPNQYLPATLSEYNDHYVDYVYVHAGTHHMQGELPP
jgi:hypothetical protein